MWHKLRKANQFQIQEMHLIYAAYVKIDNRILRHCLKIEIFVHMCFPAGIYLV